MAVKSNKKEGTSDKKNWKEDEIGALWKSEKGNGLRGTITVDGVLQRVLIFPNSFKQEGEKSPDFRVYKDNWTPDANFAKNGAEREKKSGKYTPAPNSYVEEEEVEDVPF